MKVHGYPEGLPYPKGQTFHEEDEFTKALDDRVNELMRSAWSRISNHPSPSISPEANRVWLEEEGDQKKERAKVFINHDAYIVKMRGFETTDARSLALYLRNNKKTYDHTIVGGRIGFLELPNIKLPPGLKLSYEIHKAVSGSAPRLSLMFNIVARLKWHENQGAPVYVFMQFGIPDSFPRLYQIALLAVRDIEGRDALELKQSYLETTCWFCEPAQATATTRCFLYSTINMQGRESDLIRSGMVKWSASIAIEAIKAYNSEHGTSPRHRISDKKSTNSRKGVNPESRALSRSFWSTKLRGFLPGANDSDVKQRPSTSKTTQSKRHPHA